MADTNHGPANPPVEGDGVSYRGIVWFIIVLTATTVFCQIIVWVMFDVMQYRGRTSDEARSAMAAPPASPTIQNGRLVSGTDGPPAPGLLVSESIVLGDFRKSEDQILTTYGWMDKGSEVVRVPVERAKELILQRGLPTRTPDATIAAENAETKPATVVKNAAPAPAGAKGTK